MLIGLEGESFTVTTGRAHLTLNNYSVTIMIRYTYSACCRNFRVQMFARDAPTTNGT